MGKIILAAILSLVILTGCSVKQGQLVILSKDQPASKSPGNTVVGQFDPSPETAPIEEYAAAINRLKPSMFPLAVSPDFNYVFAFENTKNPFTNSINDTVILGNMVQEINLYVVSLVDKTAIKATSLGKFLTIKSFQFDEKGSRFAFIDGSNTIYLYDISTEKLQKLIESTSSQTFNSISWSKDSNRLMLDTKMDFDIASKQFISKVVDSYTPFIKHKLYKDKYIVQMKNNEYNDMIALFDFSTRSYTTIATGIYQDCDGTNVIYTKNTMNNLNVVNLKTLESKPIESGPVYSAYIMKSTGVILYTTLNPRINSNKKYVLIKFNLFNALKSSVEVSSPTFYLSPGEDKVFFVNSDSENNLVVNTDNMMLTTNEIINDHTDLYEIKKTIYKMFLQDYTFTGNYESYENEAKKIYANTYTPIPQEALENKLIDFRRFNMPLPSVQKEAFMPPTIILNSINITKDRASVKLGFYYINSIELVKHANTWYITGFSTYPDSKEVNTIRETVLKHLADIKEKNKAEALKYWEANPNNVFKQAQRKIVEDLMDKAKSYNYWVGEIELWSSVEPHRADSPETALQAKVKVLISDGKNIVKYKLVLVRKDDSFIISSWNTDPLSISQLD